MSEGTATVAAPVAAPAAAPAAAATPAASVAAPSTASTTPATTVSPAANQATAGSEVKAEAKVETPAPEFDWEKWDGKLEVVPEPHREIAGRVSKFYTGKLTAAEKKAADLDGYKAKNELLQQQYNSMIENLGEDPRVVELSSELEKLKQEHTQISSKAKALEERWKARTAEDAKSYADKLVEQYPAYFSDQAKTKAVHDMWESGWEDPEIIIQLLELGDDAVVAATEAKKEGATEKIALKFANQSLQLPKTKSKGRPASEIMAGADGQGGAPPEKDARGKRIPFERRRLEVAAKYATAKAS